MSSAFSKATRSSKSSEYYTPKSLFDKLDRIFCFELDPCTTHENPLRLPQFFTTMEDGLKQNWNLNTFINPPFGKGVIRWIEKMHSEATRRWDNQYVMLLPARVETQWFQDHIVGKYSKGSFIYFLKGRYKFTNPEKGYQKNVLIIGNMLWVKNATYGQKVKLIEDVKGVMFETF